MQTSSKPSQEAYWELAKLDVSIGAVLWVCGDGLPTENGSYYWRARCFCEVRCAWSGLVYAKIEIPYETLLVVARTKRCPASTRLVLKTICGYER